MFKNVQVAKNFLFYMHHWKLLSGASCNRQLSECLTINSLRQPFFERYGNKFRL